MVTNGRATHLSEIPGLSVGLAARMLRPPFAHQASVCVCVRQTLKSPDHCRRAKVTVTAIIKLKLCEVFFQDSVSSTPCARLPAAQTHSV